MRWVKKYKRYVKRFAIFPIKIRNEMVWLETVYLEQKWDQYAWLWPVWIDIRFITKEEYEKSGDISVWDQIRGSFKRFRKGESSNGIR